MTTTFILSDGQAVQASNALELVCKMHEQARVQGADDKAYMLDVAERTAMQSGKYIRIGSPEEFVNDLLKHGLISTAPPSLKDVDHTDKS